MELVRNPLLDAATQALTRNFGASMSDIAKAAGVSRTTLHRAYPTRDDLVAAVAERVLAACRAQFDAAGIDDRPVLDAADTLLDSALEMAEAYALLFTEAAVYRAPNLVAEIEAQDKRFEAFFVRGQADGVFRPDLPPRWFVYAFGAQLVAMWWAVTDGYVGSRDAARVLRATIMEGLVR